MGSAAETARKWEAASSVAAMERCAAACALSVPRRAAARRAPPLFNPSAGVLEEAALPALPPPAAARTTPLPSGKSPKSTAEHTLASEGSRAVLGSTLNRGGRSNACASAPSRLIDAIADSIKSSIINSAASRSALSVSFAAACLMCCSHSAAAAELRHRKWSTLRVVLSSKQVGWLKEDASEPASACAR